MSKEQTLVDYLTDVSQYSKHKLDTSQARRIIVEERIRVNAEIITDPAFRLPFDEGFVVQIDRS